MFTYKKFNSSDAGILAFEAHKEYNFTEFDNNPNLDYRLVSFTSKSKDTFGIIDDFNHKRYFQLDHLFYNNPIFGLANLNNGANYLDQEKRLYNKATVLSISQKTTGNGIQKGTFELNNSFVDDSKGNIYVKGENLDNYPKDKDRVFYLAPVKGFKDIDLNTNNNTGQPIVNAPNTLNKISIDDSLYTNPVEFISCSIVEIEDKGCTGIKFEGGTNSYVKAPHSEKYNFNDNDFSISFYLNAEQVSSGEEFVFSKSFTQTIASSPSFPKLNENSGSFDRQEVDAGSSFPFEIVLQPGRQIVLRRSDGEVISKVGGSYSPGALEHIAFVKEGNTLKLYVDGTLRGSSTDSAKICRNKADLFIGNHGGSRSDVNSLRGTISQIMIFNKALSLTQVNKVKDSITGTAFVGNIFYEQGIVTITSPKFSVGGDSLITQTVSTRDISIPITAGTANNFTFTQDLGDVTKFTQNNITFFNSDTTDFNTVGINNSFTLGDNFSELSVGAGSVILQPNQTTAELTLAEDIRLLPIFNSNAGITLATETIFQPFLTNLISFPTGGIDIGPNNDSTSSLTTLDNTTFNTDGYSVGVILENDLETTESIALIPDTTSSYYEHILLVDPSSITSGDPGGTVSSGKTFDTTGNNYYDVWKRTGLSPTAFPNGRSSGLVYHSLKNEITGGLADTRQHQFISASDPQYGAVIGDVKPGYPEYGPWTYSGSGGFWGTSNLGPDLKQTRAPSGEVLNKIRIIPANGEGSFDFRLGGRGNTYEITEVNLLAPPPGASNRYLKGVIPTGEGLPNEGEEAYYFSYGRNTNDVSNQILSNDSGIKQQLMEEILSSSLREHLGGHFSDKAYFRNEYWDREIASELALKAIVQNMVGNAEGGSLVWTYGDMGNICNGVAIQSGINIDGKPSVVVTGSYGTVGCYTTGLQPFRNVSQFNIHDPHKRMEGEVQLQSTNQLTLDFSNIPPQYSALYAGSKTKIGKLANFKAEGNIKDDIPLSLAFRSSSYQEGVDGAVVENSLIAYFSSSERGFITSLDDDGGTAQTSGDGTLIEGLTSGSAHTNYAGDDLIERPDILFFKLVMDVKTGGQPVSVIPHIVIKNPGHPNIKITADVIKPGAIHMWEGRFAKDNYSDLNGSLGKATVDTQEYTTLIFNFRVPLRSAIQSFAKDYLAITSSFPPTSHYTYASGINEGAPVFPEAGYDTIEEYEEQNGGPHINPPFLSSNTNADDPTYADEDGFFRPANWTTDYINVLSSQATIHPVVDIVNNLHETYGGPSIANVKFGCFYQSPNPGFKNQLELMTNAFELYEITELDTAADVIVKDSYEEWSAVTSNQYTDEFNEYKRGYNRHTLIKKGKRKAIKLDIHDINTTGSDNIFQGLKKGQKKVSEYNTFTHFGGSAEANWDMIESEYTSEVDWGYERKGAKLLVGENGMGSAGTSDNQARNAIQRRIPLHTTSSTSVPWAYNGGINVPGYTTGSNSSDVTIQYGDYVGRYGKSPLNDFAVRGGHLGLPSPSHYFNAQEVDSTGETGVANAGVSYHASAFPSHHQIIKNGNSSLEFDNQPSKSSYFSKINEDLYLKIQLKPFPYDNSVDDHDKSMTHFIMDGFYWTEDGFEPEGLFATFPMPIRPSGSYRIGDGIWPGINAPETRRNINSYYGGYRATIDQKLLPDIITYENAKEQFFAPYTFISGNMTQVGSVHGYVSPTSLWDRKTNLSTEKHLEAFLYNPAGAAGTGGALTKENRVFPFPSSWVNFGAAQQADGNYYQGNQVTFLDNNGELLNDATPYDIETSLSKTRFRQIFNTLCRTNYRLFFTVVAGNEIPRGSIHSPSNGAHRAFTKAFEGFSIGQVSASIYTEQNKYKINFDSSSIAALNELEPFFDNTDINIDVPSSSMSTFEGNLGPNYQIRTDGTTANDLTPIQAPRDWKPYRYQLVSSALFGNSFQHPDTPGATVGNLNQNNNSAWDFWPQTWPDQYIDFTSHGDLISGSDGQYIHLGEFYQTWDPVTFDVNTEQGPSVTYDSTQAYTPNVTDVLDYTSSGIIVIEHDDLATFELMGVGNNFVSASYKLTVGDWITDGGILEVDRIFVGDGRSNAEVTDAPNDTGIGKDKKIQVDILKSGSGGETHIISKLLDSGSHLQNIFESTPAEDKLLGFISASEAVIVNFTVVSALNTPSAIKAQEDVFRIGQIQFNYLLPTTTINANPGTTLFPEIPDGFSSYRLDFTSPHNTQGSGHYLFDTGSISVNVTSVLNGGTTVVVDESLFITASLTPDGVDTYYADAVNPVGLPVPTLKAEFSFDAKTNAVYTFKGLDGLITTANDTPNEGIGVRVIDANNDIVAENFESSGPIALNSFITSDFTDMTFSTNGTAKFQIFTSGSGVNAVQASQGRDFNIQLYNDPVISFTELSGSRVSNQTYSLTEDERTANQLVITSSHTNDGAHKKFKTGSFDANIAGYQSVPGGFKIKLTTPLLITASSDTTASKHEYVYYNASSTLLVGDDLSDLSTELINSSFEYADPVTNVTETYIIEGITTSDETSTIQLNQPLIALEPIEVIAQYVINTSGDFNVKFKNTHLIFENEFHCTVSEDEFNHTLNASARKYKTTEHGELADFATGSKFRPYVTTVGLYNDEGELLVVGKLAQPVRTSEETDTTFVVRYDT